MDARSYIFDIVVPTLADYERDKTSVRHGFLACVAAFHAVDYLSTDEVSSSSLRQKLRRECPSFVLIDRVAHAFKHAETGHPNSTVQPLRSDEVISRPPAAWGVGVWGLSRWGDPFGGVTLASDVNADLLRELNLVLAHLKRELPIIPREWTSVICAWAALDSRIAGVHLYGSRAKGTERPDSDLDLGIVLTGDDTQEKDIYFICMASRWREALSRSLPVRIDLQQISPDTDKIVAPAVIQYGVKLYPPFLPE